MAFLACSVFSIYFVEMLIDKQYLARLVGNLIMWAVFILASGFSFGASIFGIVSVFKERRIFTGMLIVVLAVFVGLIPIVVGPSVAWL